MPKLIDRVGMRYGKLTVVRRAAGSGRPKWECNCECGRHVIADGRNLQQGNTTSCGCKWILSVKGNMVGMRFGMLTVMREQKSRRFGKSSPFAVYQCLCDCGTEHSALGMSLRNGDTISCGCAYRLAGERRRKPQEHKKFIAKLNNKRRRAARLSAYLPFDQELFSLVESEAYELASRRTNTLGVEFQVDHIVPLRSKFVCGLHNELNLRVITAVENNKKGNRYWPDMPHGSANVSN